MIVSVILLSLLKVITGSMNEPGIDYNPRMLHKEISTILGDKEYRMTELVAGDDSRSLSDTGLPINGKFFNILGDGGENITAYIGRVNSCRAGGCSNPLLSGEDIESEYFDYFILFDSEKQVKLVRVFNYAATHGQEVAVRRWLDQFVGHNGSKPLRVGKEIDAISGATISVYAIVNDVNEKSKLLNKPGYLQLVD